MTHSHSAEATFRVVYAAAYNDVLRFIQRRVDASHAEDIAAEVFLVAWRRANGLPETLDEQRAWLFGVARKMLANSLRSDQRRQGLSVRIGVHTSEDTSDTTAGAAVANVDVIVAWRRLTASQQEALALATWDGLTSAQAAEVLDISSTAYRIRLSRARRALRVHLGQVSPAHTTSLSTAHEGTSS